MILCCGEALIDMLPVTLPGGGTAFVPHAGGAVFNTALALGQLGARVGLFTGLSQDFLGDLLAQRLIEAGVDTSTCRRVDRPCTLAFVRLVEGQASYAFYDEGTAGRMLAPDDLPPTGASALFFGGISLVVEPCATAHEALFHREAGQRVVMVDPNIRPGFVSDEGAYRARLGRMLAKADIVKLSREDLDWLAPRAGEAFVQGLIGAGTALVLITDGPRGARALTRDLALHEPARKVAVVDTVGAGDTFNAGLLAGLQRAGLLERAALARIGEADLRTALKLGVAAAAVTVSRPGADPPWPSELA